MITRVSLVARPAAPSAPMTEVNAAGGTARGNRRRGDPPISFSARLIAPSGSAGFPGSAAPDRVPTALLGPRRDAHVHAGQRLGLPEGLADTLHVDHGATTRRIGGRCHGEPLESVSRVIPAR